MSLLTLFVLNIKTIPEMNLKQYLLKLKTFEKTCLQHIVLHWEMKTKRHRIRRMMSYEYFVWTFQFSHLSLVTLKRKRPERKTREKKTLKTKTLGKKKSNDGDEELIPIRFVSDENFDWHLLKICQVERRKKIVFLSTQLRIGFFILVDSETRRRWWCVQLKNQRWRETEWVKITNPLRKQTNPSVLNNFTVSINRFKVTRHSYPHISSHIATWIHSWISNRRSYLHRYIK